MPVLDPVGLAVVVVASLAVAVEAVICEVLVLAWRFVPIRAERHSVSSCRPRLQIAMEVDGTH